MIARIRGDHDTRWGRWRPRAAGGDGAAGVAAIRRPRRRWDMALPRRRVVQAALVVGATVIIGALLAARWLSPGPASAQLPTTPRGWLDAYEAAAIDAPSRVCSELFAPQLAQAYGASVHSSCRSYFEHITSVSVTIRRVFTDGDTAVVELRQMVRPRDWAVVLNRQAGGWRAVDLLAGNLVR